MCAVMLVELLLIWWIVGAVNVDIYQANIATCIADVNGVKRPIRMLSVPDVAQA